MSSVLVNLQEVFETPLPLSQDVQALPVSTKVKMKVDLAVRAKPLLKVSSQKSTKLMNRQKVKEFITE